MNTKQLKDILAEDNYTKVCFVGIFPSDQLPEIKQFPSILIANVDSSTQPGSHWVAFYFTRDKKGEFYDSYGNPPQEYKEVFSKFLRANVEHWTHNTRTIQSPWSSVCGQHCLFYLLHRCRNVPMSTIIQLFTPNQAWNDMLVEDFIQRHFETRPVANSKDCLVQQICKALL